MIAPNPDAAYEICTVFAPNCNYLSQLDYNSLSHINEDNYENENETDSNEDDFYLLPHNSTIEHPVRMNKLLEKLSKIIRITYKINPNFYIKFCAWKT